MKYLVVVLALCIVGVFGGITEEQKAKLKEHKDICMAETKVEEDIIIAAKAGNIPEDDEKFKCYCSCMLKRIGIMNADGTFNEKVFREKMPATVPKEKIDQVLEKCKDLSGSTECETGFKLMKCYYKEKDFSIFD